jgi:simple sugar transport system ATP-binding protein
VTTVQIRGLVKRFGTVTALRGAHLSAQAGEVHGVLGENGAGKTTLLSILAGLLAPDEGEILLEGSRVVIPSPRHARALGVGMVHQHFALVPRLTVLENLMLGWPGPLFNLPETEVSDRARRLEDETGLRVPLDAPVESLGVGERQRVEILKVLLQEPSILILDEPTAVLSPVEVNGFLNLVRSLAARGTAVLMVAHKLDEVLAVAHRVTVLRRGETVLEASRSEVDAPALARAMVGSETAGTLVHLREARGGAAAPALLTGDPVARLESVTALDTRGVTRLTEVSLEVYPGEIVGVAGVEGNGQRQLARILAGELQPDSGTAFVPSDAAFIPQDRRSEGLVEDFDLTENLALRLHRWARYRRGALVDWPALRARSREALATFSIRAEGPETMAGTLSGGNQQRVVLARELEGDPAFLVAENPTRGLDVAGESFVHRTLQALKAREPVPAGVVLISTDLDEILALADRFFVMVRGRLEPVAVGDGLRERLGERMLGAG